MLLHLLGTGGYHPNEHRHTACLMLPEQGIVLDAGTAMFRVREQLIAPELDIFLTHAHLDHVIGLTFLMDVIYQKPVDRVTIHGTAESLAAVREHLFAQPLFPVFPKWEFRPLEQTVKLAEGGKLTHFPLIHPGGAVGYRLDWPGHSLAYVTDTTAAADAAYIEQIRDVDVLVHECYFDDSQPAFARLTGHSCTSAVAQVAAESAVGRLLLVHVNPLDERADPVDLATARKIFTHTELATDGLVVEF